MPYVKRTAGVVSAVYTHSNPDALEFLDKSDPEVVTFLNPSPPTNEEIYDKLLLQSKLLKALVLSLNDGTLPVGTDLSNAQLKTIIKANM